MDRLEVVRIAQVLILLLSIGIGIAGEVRIDFLTEAKAQEGFGAVLQTNGISKEAKSNLLQAIKDFYEEPLVLDLKKFPEARGDGYRFESMESLTNALPTKLWETPHSWSLNCFDALILAAGKKIGYQLQMNALAGPFFAVVTETNQLSVRPCATAEDAFVIEYPEWYRDATMRYFASGQLHRHRVCLTALLFSSYVLPLATKESNLEEVALRVVRARWDRYAVRFKDVEVVLAHEVNIAGRYFITGHAGLLMRTPDGYVYFEKCGGSGPFVKLDFTKREELETWFTDKYRWADAKVYSHHMISFDDREMRLIRK